jgi:hypothetical protein
MERDSKNDAIDDNNDTNETLYYVQQYKSKIFKHIPDNIRKNIQFLNIFTDNFKPYHVALEVILIYLMIIKNTNGNLRY